jgi:hypothetical protein
VQWWMGKDGMGWLDQQRTDMEVCEWLDDEDDDARTTAALVRGRGHDVSQPGWLDLG